MKPQSTFRREETTLKCSVSNIAWTQEQDEEMYSFLKKNEIRALEIAPSRLFGETPYERPKEARRYALWLKEKFGLEIVSMQSIWYGRKENLFASVRERDRLGEYTRQAIRWAAEVGCANLVFGCPGNRRMGEEGDKEALFSIAEEFFAQMGAYAAQNGVALALEANPALYGTDFLNTTQETVSFVKKVSCMEDQREKLLRRGLGINLDTGAMLANGEENRLPGSGEAAFISHVHLSEPGLVRIEERAFHRQLISKLAQLGYDRFISVEMKGGEALRTVQEAVLYLKRLSREVEHG